MIEAVHTFLDCITEAFTDLSAVADGRLAPLELRQQSLLGSIGMLRVLAGVFHGLAEDMELEGDDITEFFRRLNPHMNAPVGGIWLTTQAHSDFEPKASAPIMRTQNLQHLVAVIVSWCKNPPSGL